MLVMYLYHDGALHLRVETCTACWNRWL